MSITVLQCRCQKMCMHYLHANHNKWHRMLRVTLFYTAVGPNRKVYFFQSVFEFFGGALPSDWHFAFFNNSVDLLQFSVQFCLLIFGTRPPCLASIRHLDSILEGSSVNLQNKNHCFSGWHQTRIYSRFFCSVIYIAQQLVFCILH